MAGVFNCCTSCLQCTVTPFKDEFEVMLGLYGQDKDSHKRLASSIKNISATFSYTGSFLLVVVWAVGGANVSSLHDDNVWGSASDAGNTLYRCLTTCASIMCILLVGTTTRTYLLLDMIPLGGHRAMIRRLTHFYIVGLPYFLFGVILVLIGFSIALQATLNNGVLAGSLVGGFLLILTLLFIWYWVWADKQLMKALDDFSPRPANGCQPPIDNGAHAAV